MRIRLSVSGIQSENRASDDQGLVGHTCSELRAKSSQSNMTSEA